MQKSRDRTSLRRRSIVLAYASGALWSVGNGLTTGTLIYYLLMDLGARGLQLSLILALPALVGVLRMLAPALIRRCGGVARACRAALLASYLIFPTVPICLLTVEQPAVLLPTVIALICLHQLLEYMGQVALYAWLADLVPQRVRGRFFARRNMWQLAALIPTLLAGGYFMQFWRASPASATLPGLLLGYALPLALGSAFLLASLAPLFFMVEVGPRGSADRDQPVFSWRRLLVPFADGRFRRLLWYRAWFSFSNGITQAAQNIYPRRVLGFDTGDISAMRTAMQTGQFIASPAIGRWADRIGNRPVLFVSQALVSASLIFFLASTPLTRWLLWGAWILWAAYAGINICLPNLTVKLAPPGPDRAGYVAAQEAVGGIFYAVSTVLGGVLFDKLEMSFGGPEFAIAAPPACEILFLAGLALRTLALVFVARLQERKP